MRKTGRRGSSSRTATASGSPTSAETDRGFMTARLLGSISPQTMMTARAAIEKAPAAAVRPPLSNWMPMTAATAK